MMKPILIALYIAAMIGANLLVWWLGPWFSPINSFFLIGFDLTLRDVMHEQFNRWQLTGIIAIGALLTWILNPATASIAIASATAFAVAAAIDTVTYEWLRRHHWFVRSNGSNIFGAATDSVIFPMLAFGVFLPHIIALQFLAKVGGAAIWSVVLRPLVKRINGVAHVG